MDTYVFIVAIVAIVSITLLGRYAAKSITAMTIKKINHK